MSDVSVETVLELDALRLAVPMPKATVRWAADVDEPLLGDPIMVVPYAIANEHVGLHAVLLDRPLPDYSSADAVRAGVDARTVSRHRADDIDGIRQAWSRGDAVFIATWDGRDPDGRRATLRAVAALLAPMFDDPDRPPRLIVPTGADWTLLRDAFAWELPLRRSHHDDAVESFALRCHWWIERAKIPGQLSVVVLSDQLHRSWQVPLEPDDRLHLGASLACFGSEAGAAATLLPAVRAAEARPSGPRSLPTFDNSIFLDALAAVGRPPELEPWSLAVDVLWDHLAHRHLDLHRATRVVLGDPGLPAAASVAPTGLATKPGLVEVEQRAWVDHRGRRQQVEVAYAAYDDAHSLHGPEHTATDAARRDATSLRNRTMPRHLARSRFHRIGALTDALDLRRIIEDRVARAEARRRGIALPGHVVIASAPTPGAPVSNGSQWVQHFTFQATIGVPGDRPLGRFRVGSTVSVGPYGFDTIDSILGEAVVTEIDHAARTITVSYTRKATSTVAPTRIRVPRPRLPFAAAVELLPTTKYSKLGEDFLPTGPRPSTHVRPAGGGPVVIGPSTAAFVPVPEDLT